VAVDPDEARYVLTRVLSEASSHLKAAVTAQRRFVRDQRPPAYAAMYDTRGRADAAYSEAIEVVCLLAPHIRPALDEAVTLWADLAGDGLAHAARGAARGA
jgi:hypothetical protein